MLRLITAAVAVAVALSFATAAFAHAPRPGTAAWNRLYLPSPAPGYLPKTVPFRFSDILPKPARRQAAARPFAYRDAAIGAAVAALSLAVLGGALLVAIRARGEGVAEA